LDSPVSVRSPHTVSSISVTVPGALATEATDVTDSTEPCASNPTVSTTRTQNHHGAGMKSDGSGQTHSGALTRNNRGRRLDGPDNEVHFLAELRQISHCTHTRIRRGCHRGQVAQKQSHLREFTLNNASSHSETGNSPATRPQTRPSVERIVACLARVVPRSRTQTRFHAADP
jgi:hypothetical protein